MKYIMYILIWKGCNILYIYVKLCKIFLCLYYLCKVFLENLEELIDKLKY